MIDDFAVSIVQFFIPPYFLGKNRGGLSFRARYDDFLMGNYYDERGVALLLSYHVVYFNYLFSCQISTFTRF